MGGKENGKENNKTTLTSHSLSHHMRHRTLMDLINEIGIMSYCVESKRNVLYIKEIYVTPALI